MRHISLKKSLQSVCYFLSLAEFRYLHIRVQSAYLEKDVLLKKKN